MGRRNRRKAGAAANRRPGGATASPPPLDGPSAGPTLSQEPSEASVASVESALQQEAAGAAPTPPPAQTLVDAATNAATDAPTAAAACESSAGGLSAMTSLSLQASQQPAALPSLPPADAEAAPAAPNESSAGGLSAASGLGSLFEKSGRWHDGGGAGALPEGDGELAAVGSAAAQVVGLSASGIEPQHSSPSAAASAAPAAAEAPAGLPAQQLAPITSAGAGSDDGAAAGSDGGSSDAEAADGQPGSEPDAAPAPPPPPRLSVRQLMEAREKEREAAAAAAAALNGSAPSPRSAGSPRHSLHASPSHTRLHASPSHTRLHASPSHTRLHASPSHTRLDASPSHTRLDGSASSPSLGHGRRAAASPTASPTAAGAGRAAAADAAAAEPSVDGGSLLGFSGSGSMSTLLLPTASYVAGVEETRRLREERLRGEESLRELSSYAPQPTEVAPFKLRSDQRAEGDWARVGPAGQLTTEEQRALEAEAGKKELARQLAGARERCRKVLSASPPQRPSSPREPSPPTQFVPFNLRSAERHAAYAERFEAKVAEARRQEDEACHRSSSHGSRPSSRIGALHGPSGGSPPQLATAERAARAGQRSAERRQHEEAASAAKDAARREQLSLEEREVEAERAQRRFKARPAPDFKSKPVWSPDTRQAKAPTVPVAFRLGRRRSSSSGGGGGGEGQGEPPAGAASQDGPATC